MINPTYEFKVTFKAHLKEIIEHLGLLIFTTLVFGLSLWIRDGFLVLDEIMFRFLILIYVITSFPFLFGYY